MIRDTAVLSIDVQASFEHTPYWRTDDVPGFMAHLRRLLAGAHARQWPVVRILHEQADGPFSAASGLLRPLHGLEDGAAVEFRKQAHNAFTSTGLDLWLRRQGIRRLVVAGIRTEQCCETTARVASDLGYQVDFVTEATLTFPMRHAGSGREYAPEDIKARTELVLDRRFARIATVEDALAA